MKKKKRWQHFLILIALILTVYNILPTIFYYTKHLQDPISESQAHKISSQIIQRVNLLEKESKEWLTSFCKLLQIKPQSITLDEKNSQHFIVQFKNAEDANFFSKHLQRSGSLIAFVPSQLQPYEKEENFSKTVIVQRKIPLHFNENSPENYFQYSTKFGPQKQPTALYKNLIFDRALSVILATCGPSQSAKMARAALEKEGDRQELIENLAQSLVSYAKAFEKNDAIAKRYFSSYSQIDEENKEAFVQQLTQALEQAKNDLKLEKVTLQSQGQSLQSKGLFLDTAKKQRLELLTIQEKNLESAEVLIKKHKNDFTSGKNPWSLATITSKLEESFLLAQEQNSEIQSLFFENHNPYIEKLTIDWQKGLIYLHLYGDLASLKTNASSSLKDQLDLILYNEIAHHVQTCGESIKPKDHHFQISLNSLENSSSFLVMQLSAIADAKCQEIYQILTKQWKPKHPDLLRNAFGIWVDQEYAELPAHEKKLGLVIHSPLLQKEPTTDGLQNSSVYVVAKGLDKILQKLQSSPQSESAKIFFEDFNKLKELLQKNGLFGYPGNTLTANKKFRNDFIFEAENFYFPILQATRENFKVHGTKRYATLEFTNFEQRLLTTNKICDALHEDLLKWRDDYQLAQLKMGGFTPYDIVTPLRNVLFENIKLSLKKYFSGDERKVLHWGLDLSGGKTVQIELRDQNFRLVNREEDIKQGINELYARVNKMGVSEVNIRREGNTITLDFPGSQNLSAKDLIKSSTMYFHVVNEKFNEKNPALASFSQQFLQDIWNEAVVTGRKTAEEINQIAWRHLHGDSLDSDVMQPRSESARILYENGLRLASPKERNASNLFNDAVSEIALMRGNDFTQWQGKTHPLLLVFHHFALEGASLKNVQSGYDPNKGNFLAFEVKGKELLKSGENINPREDLHAWTSQFSKDKITGTANASLSNHDGWRMAVVLNGTIITSPTLSYPIRDGGSIEGSFTQREVNQLEADLKAGSLSFTPHILSEKNVSPELGIKERNFGILATFIALALVIFCMIAYYRFGGFIASLALILNLLMMWAILQNLGATLTLASIAGGILTLGMAVDANVLIFERIREEFALSGRLATAMHAGYRKAFSAILDSNITTIIAALVLLQFDSGPIKGFAVTLIVGIISSMFTALFMTRFFFFNWVQNPKHVVLKMSQFIKSSNFNFLKYTKLAFILSFAFILVGGSLFIYQRNSIIGMDFSGGYSLNLELQPKDNFDYREAVEKALTTQGISSKNFQIRQLSAPHQIRLFLSKNLQHQGNPFFGMPLQNTIKNPVYAYQNNPRIDWVVKALGTANLAIFPNTLDSLDQNWNEISGQLSDSMRNSALIGLFAAILCILVYITIRFEFKYAVSATLCLAHDIVITLASIALLHFLGLPVQIDLNTIAALMTIVGYSLNDTIIVFDRIREDIRLMRKSSFSQIINHALNVTLSRTTMTSGTTLVVLLPLVLLGGSTIFAFSLVMIIGVVFGTLSSLFIAAPLLNYFHTQQQEKERSPEIVR